MLMYFHSLVNTGNFPLFHFKCAGPTKYLLKFIHSNKLFKTLLQSFYIALSHISIRDPYAEGSA